MAISRYRHFWSSKLEFAPTGTVAGGATNETRNTATGAVTRGTANAAVTLDLTGILKSYSPPRIVREVRQIETGKYLNERILGRLQPEETNFSLTIPSDFEEFYVYNGDYQFEILEELHGNNNPRIRYVVDEVKGTLFDREWTDFMQNGQDRDVTLHFILKNYTRTFANDVFGGGNPVEVFSIEAGLDAGQGSFKTRGLSFEMGDLVARPDPNTDGAFLTPDGTSTMDEDEAEQIASGRGGLVDMFRGNYGTRGTDTDAAPSS